MLQSVKGKLFLQMSLLFSDVCNIARFEFVEPLNKYGCLGDTTNPLTVDTCPVKDNLSFPEARSQILITRSAEPVQNHSLPGSTATWMPSTRE